MGTIGGPLGSLIGAAIGVVVGAIVANIGLDRKERTDVTVEEVERLCAGLEELATR